MQHSRNAPGTVRNRHLAVVAAALVLVANQHRDGRPQRDSVRANAWGATGTASTKSRSAPRGCARPPDRISQVSSSFRGVVMRDCPGRRRSSSNCMSGPSC